MSQINYRAEIDGLRAVAISAVIIFHAGFDILPGGFLGVDVFFVISGFLITSILTKEFSNGSFSLVKFYERRARRILPALLLVCLCIVPFAVLLLEPSAIKNFFKSLAATGVFSSNFLFYFGDNYFSLPVEESLLLHTWSLAVEEQYYLFFPLLFGFIWRGGKTVTLLVLTVLMLTSLVAAEVIVDRAAAFFLLPTRGWELLVGSFVSFIGTTNTRNAGWRLLSELLALLGFSLIIYSLVFFDKSSHLPGFLSLIPVIGTALVISCASTTGFVGRMLSFKPVVYIGLISYSAYLWHQPIFAIAEASYLAELSVVAKLSLIILTLMLAALSRKYVELPAKSYKFAFQNKALYASAISLLFICILGVGGYQNQWPNKVNWIDYDTAHYGGLGYNSSEQGMLYGIKSEPISFILYGDSHAIQYLAVLDRWAKNNNKSFLAITHSACLSFPNYTNVYKVDVRSSCTGLVDVLNSAMEKLGNIPVVFSYRWSKKLALREPYQPLGLAVEEQGVEGSFDETALQLLIDDIKVWKMSWPNSKWLLIGNVPGSGLIEERGYIKCHYYNDTTCMDYFSEEKGELFYATPFFERLAEGDENISFLSPYDAVCSGGNCQVVDDEGLLYYSDHAHFSLAGAEKMMTKLNKYLVF